MEKRRKRKQLELFGHQLEHAQARAQLLKRLRKEGADDLTARLEKCGLEFFLWCKDCGHRHPTQTRCNRKWCPVCAPRRANERAAKLRVAIAAMRWPMHITLTVPNVHELVAGRSFLRRIVKNFARLRRSKLWRQNVKGGAAGVEVTNKGKGWHPHIHAVLDCRWLALKTPAPHHTDDHVRLKTKFRCAAQELQAAWAVANKEPVPTSIYIRRCDAGAASEIVKYALKSQHMDSIDGELAPILRLIDSVRMVTTFGSLRGLKIPNTIPSLQCPLGHSNWSLSPPAFDLSNLSHKEQLRQQRAAEFESKIASWIDD